MILFDRSARANQVAIVGFDVLFFAPVTQSFENELQHEYHLDVWDVLQGHTELGADVLLDRNLWRAN